MAQREDGILTRVLGQTADGAFAINGDNRIMFWNRAAEKILGYTGREALGRQCCEIFAGRDESGNRLCYKGCHVSSLVQMGEPVHSFDMQTRTKAGAPVWLNVSTLAAPKDQEPMATVHLFRDVTATKELLRLVQQRLAPAPPSSNGDVGLTRRELEVLRLMATGANTKGVAERLHVSPATIRNHVQNLLGKLGVHSRLEAVAYATNHRLL